jgi:hypothetical protein
VVVTAEQVRLHSWPGMRLSWLGAGAVVHHGDEPGQGAASLVVSPHGSTECAVVVSSHSVSIQPRMVEELAEVLANGLPRGFTSMRFVAWDGACANGDRPAPAHILAMRLGIDVVSAAGPLLGVPGGSLFTPVGRGPQRPGGWWRFRAGANPVRVGWRFPAPAWEAELCEIGELPGDLVLDHIPAGLWLHRRKPGDVSDLAFSVPTDPASPTLILSHPSEEPLRSDEIGRGISAIPGSTTERMVFTPYGQQPVIDGPIGPIVADMLGRAVHVRTGLPLCAPAGQRAVVTIDDKGLPRWRTFARELWHAPRSGAPRAVDWINPAPEVLTEAAGAATFSLGAGWVCEVIQSGLWVRPEQLADPAEWVRGLPVDVNRCAIVLGAPHAPEITPPGHMIAGVLERMPVDARKRAYIAVPRGAAPNVFVLATALRDRLPEPSEVELLGSAQSVPAPALTPIPGSYGPSGSYATVPSAGYPTVVNPNGYATGPSGAHAAVPPAAFNAPAQPAHGAPPPGLNGAHAAMHTGSHPISHPGSHPGGRSSSHAAGPTGAHSAGPTNGSRPVNGAHSAGPVNGSRPANGAHAAPPAGGATGGHNGSHLNGHTGAHPSMPTMATGAHAAVPDDTAVNGYNGAHGNGANGSHANGARLNGGMNGHGYATGAHSAVPNANGVNGTNGAHRRDAAPGEHLRELPPRERFRDVPPPDRREIPAERLDVPMRPSRRRDPRIDRPMDPRNGETVFMPPAQRQPVHDYAPPPAPQPPRDYAPPGRPARDYVPPAQPPRDFTPPGHDFIQPPAHEFQPVSPPRQSARPPMPAALPVPPPPVAPPSAAPTAMIPPVQAQPVTPMPPMPVVPAVPVVEEPATPPPPAQPDDESTTSIRTGKEIRSHGRKPAKRSDDRTNTQELDRLLGFFDEIRRAKAWDEDPAPEQPEPARSGGGRRRH